MLKSHFEHTLYAILLALPVTLLTGSWWAGSAFGSAFFIGREHAQAEIEYLFHTKKKRHEVKWLELKVLTFKKAWSTDAILDWVVPTVVLSILAYWSPIHL